jgi:hypothetical protein
VITTFKSDRAIGEDRSPTSRIAAKKADARAVGFSHFHGIAIQKGGRVSEADLALIIT